MSNAQRTEGWHKDRLGRVTASRIKAVMMKKETAGRQNLMAELICERLTGEPTKGFSTPAMEWGTQTEPQARDAYSAYAGELVTESPMVRHPTIEWAGASPDGIVGDGLVEIKCPNTATHLDTLLMKQVPAEYIPQMMWQMACTGAKWVDFVSYDPRLPPKLRLFVKRVERDDKQIEKMESEVRKFLGELEEKLAKLKEISGE